MRRFAPIFALTLVASTTLFAGSARADEGQPVAPTSAPQEAPPAMVPPPAPSPSTERSALKRRPVSIREFDAARSALNERLRSLRASGGKGSDEEDQLRDDVSTLERWRDEDTEMTSTSGFVGGIVMVSVGGTVAALAGICLASDAFFHKGGSDVATCGALTVGGLVGGLAGIGLLVYGSPQVMKVKAQSTTLFAPSARLLVGPGTIGVGGTF